MKQPARSATRKGSTVEIVEDEKSNEELVRLRNENMKLSGEVSILRQNMILLEKQNFAMKEQRSQAMVSELKASERLRKEITALKIENRIRENQLRTFKRPKTEMSIDIRWALSRAKNEMSLSLLPFEINRLRFLKDFFYPDFCQFDTRVIITEMKNILPRFKEFLEFYLLFSCKMDVFKEFFCTVFMNAAFPSRKIELLESLPLDWLFNANSEGFINLIKEYATTNYTQMPFFFLRIVEERPFLLNIFITKDMFTDIAGIDSRVARKFVSEVCKKGGLSLVDHTNMHCILQSDLRILYQESYFELLF